MTYINLTEDENRKIEQHDNLIHYFFKELYKIYYQLWICIEIHNKQFHGISYLRDLYIAYEQLYIINLYQLLEFKKKTVTDKLTKQNSNIDYLSVFERIYYEYQKINNLQESEQIVKNINKVNKLLKDNFDSSLDDIRHLIWHINYTNISKSHAHEYAKWNHWVIGTMQSIFNDFDKLTKFCEIILNRYSQSILKNIFKEWIPNCLTVSHISNREKEAMKERLLESIKDLNKIQ